MINFKISLDIEQVSMFCENYPDFCRISGGVDIRPNPRLILLPYLLFGVYGQKVSDGDNHVLRLPSDQNRHILDNKDCHILEKQ